MVGLILSARGVGLGVLEVLERLRRMCEVVVDRGLAGVPVEKERLGGVGV